MNSHHTLHHPDSYPWKFSFIARFFLSTLSGVLLILAYPRFDWSFLAWVALVPLFIVLDVTRKAWKGFLWAYWSGLIFFTGTLYWFIHVTLPGMMLLMVYLAVYFGLFGLLYVFYRRKSRMWRLLLFPSLWVALEFLRDHAITGFGWVSLGHSQYQFIPLIQIADITGVAGLSFLVLMVNVMLKEILQHWYGLKFFWPVGKNFAEIFFDLKLRRMFYLTIGIVWLVLVYGFYRLETIAPGVRTMNVAVIQGNIPQDIKWAPQARGLILEKQLALTRRALKSPVDLVIWPETSLPGYMWEEPELYDSLKRSVAELKVPLIVGAVRQKNGKYYNSAILLGPDGKEEIVYDKVHLVPFGEFLPFRPFFPFLEDIVPIEDFSRGTQTTLFPGFIEGKRSQSEKFSVLICFEDTLGRVVRPFVQAGAGLLVNITNDAWFLDTKAPFLHLQAAVFRTVENRRGLVRAANTGVSCFIDQFGRIDRTLGNPLGKKTFVSGFAIGKVAFHTQKTFYTKFGEIFTYFCFGCILMEIVLPRRKVSQGG